MSRIRKAYEHRFRTLLLRVRARRLEKGVSWLLGKSIEPNQTNINVRLLSNRYEHLRNQVKRWASRDPAIHHPNERPAPELRFFCDAGLGGLARWLRAAGYEALWTADIEDAELLRRAQQLRAIVLTTDSLMMERGVLRDGIIPALWLPPALTMQEHLSLVFREFDLVIREARCMRCGGELIRAQKETMRDRIPPKTWRWIDEYFVCGTCGQLFWRGTHWGRIRDALREAGGERTE